MTKITYRDAVCSMSGPHCPQRGALGFHSLTARVGLYVVGFVIVR